MQIMIIDNDRHIRESLSTFFNAGKQNLLIFKNAKEGLNALKYQDIDLVIADYFLPDMSGIEFLIQVAEQSPGTSRIIMATISSDALKKQSQDAGIDMFVEKPLSVASIDHMVSTILASRTDKKMRRI